MMKPVPIILYGLYAIVPLLYAIDGKRKTPKETSNSGILTALSRLESSPLNKMERRFKHW